MGASAGRSALRLTFATSIAALLICTSGATGAWASTAGIIAPSDPHAPSVESGWQAGTCKAETPATCSVATPEQFFETASAHPQVGFTQFIVRNEPSPTLASKKPVGELQIVHVDLPVGLSVNPGATERCRLETFEAGAAGCPTESKVGYSEVTASPPPLYLEVPPAEPLTKVPVYNVAPKTGEPARFGLELAGNEVFLEAALADTSDYHEGFTIRVPKALPIPGIEGLILKNRLVFNGQAGDGTFITTPSTCLGEAFTQSGSAYSTYLLAASYEEEAQPGYQFPHSAEPRFESPIPPGTSPKSCNTIPYGPAVHVDPKTPAVDSPAGAEVGVEVPHILGKDTQDSSDTRSARVTLPVGMGINPSAANGLQTCTEAQFGKGTSNPIECPSASKIGTVEITSPPLPEGDLTGDVYVAQQESRDPTSGREYRIFVDANSSRYGVDVRLIGNVSADPTTGQLTTTFSETPQVPFTSFTLRFDGGPRAVLSSPGACGPNETRAVMTPWAPNPAPTATRGFTLTSAPAGGACPKALAERPFGPSFAAQPASAKAGAFSPFSIDIARPDGQQELKGVEVKLPPGLSGKLAGTPYCLESALAAAAANSGAAEQAHSSCPAASQVGVAKVAAGTGTSPLQIEGRVFLAGPYDGAPLSLAVVTPATAGPFDLGTVVVRVALFVNPETAQVDAVSDPIPDVFGGAKLDIRAVEVDVDKKEFTLNPTSCGPLATSGALRGGGANPADPGAFSAFAVSDLFQTTECGALAFKPKLYTRLFGGRKATRRAQHPQFRAVLMAREGDANISRAALTLPHSEFLDQAHIRTICTRVQLAADACPAGAVYGYARARTPLLGEELAGPVYLVSSSNPLPDLLADLRGQVDVQLHGVISTGKGGRIKTVFYPVPDVPVSKFVLTMQGGKRGLLVNSRDLCAKRSFSFLNFKAQNGKQLREKRLPLRDPACRGGKASRRKHD